MISLLIPENGCQEYSSYPRIEWQVRAAFNPKACGGSTDMACIPSFFIKTSQFFFGESCLMSAFTKFLWYYDKKCPFSDTKFWFFRLRNLKRLWWAWNQRMRSNWKRYRKIWKLRRQNAKSWKINWGLPDIDKFSEKMGVAG